MENLRSKASLTCDLADLYKNSLMTDFAIKIEGKTVKTHKAILCARNRYFLETISAQPGVNKIEVLNLQAEAFETFLQFLYTGDLDKDNVNEHLLQVAQKFSASELKQICENHLMERMEKKDAIKTLIFALEMDSKLLVDKACTLIVQNYDELKLLDEFKNLTFNHKASAAIFDAFDKKERSTSDSSSNIKKVVVTKDIDGEVLKKYLEFIQSGSIAPKDINKELLLVAIKNSNQRLVDICDKHFSLQVNHQNVIDLLNLSTENSLPLLTAATVNYVTKNLDPMNFQNETMTTGASILNLARKKINDMKRDLLNLTNFKREFILDVPWQNEVISETFYVNNLPWRIVLRKQDKKAQEPYLFLYLQCMSEDVFNCQVSSTMKLVSFYNESEVALNKQNIKFSSSGQRKLGHVFIPWADLSDWEKGFVNDDGQLKFLVDVVVRPEKRKPEGEDADSGCKRSCLRAELGEN